MFVYLVPVANAFCIVIFPDHAQCDCVVYIGVE